MTGSRAPTTSTSTRGKGPAADTRTMQDRKASEVGSLSGSRGDPSTQSCRTPWRALPPTPHQLQPAGMRALQLSQVLKRNWKSGAL